jgi:RecA-family ATPase
MNPHVSQTARDIAMEYAQRGWNPVPVPFKSKRPIGKEWQHRVIREEDVPQYFNGEPQNIGVMMGEVSNGLTDADLDCQEAIDLASWLLPRTGALFGRTSKPASHRLYRTRLCETTYGAAIQFKDPTRGASDVMLLELRIGAADANGEIKGCQTIFPGSVHETGEQIAWDEGGEPDEVDGERLLRDARLIASCCLLVRYWPGNGHRHDVGLALGGFFARAGFDVPKIKEIVEAIARAARDEEWRDRVTAARDHANEFRAGRKARGLPTLKKIFGEEVGRQVADWLEYRGQAEDFPYTDDAPPMGDTVAKAPQPLQWLDMSRWDNEPVPERKWAIRDRVPLNQCGLFSGEGGTGKSIIELMKNVAHVAGKDWLGSVPEQGPAFYLGGEDEKDEIHIRLAAIAKHSGVTFKQLVDGGLHVLPLLGEDMTLCAPTNGGKVEVTALYKQLYEAAGDIKPKNISIDTLSRAFAGNEIDRVQVYAFAMHMQKLAKVAGGSVTVLSHPSLQGINSGSGISGSTAWHGAFRFRQYLKSPKTDAGEQPDNDLRELEFKKNQYGPRGETIVLRYQNGLFLPERGTSSLDQLARKAKAEEVFLELLRRFADKNRNVSDKPTAPNFAPSAFAKEEEAKKHGLKKSDFEQTMRDLFSSDKITLEQYDKPSRGLWRLTVKHG